MIQASSQLENLKLGDSPVKKLHFASVDKENAPANIPAPIIDDLEHKKPLVEVYDAKKEVKPTVAPTIKAEEADEPLLQENPHRFVLFPIKYHEVCVYHTRHAQIVLGLCLLSIRYGKCTRKRKPPSGPPKKLTSPKTSTTGTID